MYKFFPYVIFSGFSFIMLVFLALYAMRYSNNTGVREFILSMLASAWWVFCQAFELMSVTLNVKLFWASIEYLGTFSAFTYLMLAMRFTGHDEFLIKRNKRIVLIIYLVFYFFIFTDPYWGLMRTNFSLDTSAIPYTIDKDYGLLYPLYMLFTYSMNSISLFLLAMASAKKDALHKKQALILFIGLGFIALTNLSYIFGLSPVKRFDIAPAFFGASALVVFWGIIHNRLLNIMPIARNLLLERVGSGVIVIDRDNVVIDINQSALSMFQIKKPEIIGCDLSKAPLLAERLLSEDGVRDKEFTLYHADDGREFSYEFKTYPFDDKESKKAGTLIIVTDVTEHRKNTEEIIRQQKALGVMQERERVGRELHDGLGQVFGYINAQAQAVREYIAQNKNTQAIKSVEKLIEVSRDAHDNVREYILGMRGISPRNRNFSSVLKQYASEFAEKYGIPVKVIFGDDLPEGFPGECQAVVLLRIIQEALNNVRKHAGPCDAEIAFRRKADSVEVSIKDSGIGFDPGLPQKGNHYGLTIMRERAIEMGADLRIFSRKGAGTEIAVEIPD